MQDWEVTTRHGVTRKIRRARSKTNKKAVQIESKDKRCLLTADLKLLRS